jgi:hypothetical protein
VVVEYFTKWVEAMQTYNKTLYTTTHFFFNHIITFFGVAKHLVLHREKHFKKNIFQESSLLLNFTHEFPSPYYLQSNGQVEVVNKILKTMLH